MIIDAICILETVGPEEVLKYSPTQILNIVLAIVVLIGAFDKGYAWYKSKRSESHQELSSREDLETTVESDHDRLELIERQMMAMSNGVKEVLRTNLMEAHDKYMSRTPYPYITKYERLMYINMYDAYAALNHDTIVEGFKKELLEIPVLDTSDVLSGRQNNRRR